MARYKVLAKAYIDGRIVEEGEEVEFSGKVRPEDEHLVPIDDTANKRQVKADAERVDTDVRAEAISLKLLDDGNQPIDANTAIDVVTRKLAEYKQANVFK
ncbi:hypothetical protein [Labrys neptuniae]